MKRKTKKVTLICLVLCLAVCLSSCFMWTLKEKLYYSDKTNFVHASGTVTHLAYNTEKSRLLLGFSELVPKFDGCSFEIVSDNFWIVMEQGIEQKIKIGDRVEFMSAPRYFGDGYVMPIVSITVNGEVLLEFEQGYENFMKWLKKL